MLLGARRDRAGLPPESRLRYDFWRRTSQARSKAASASSTASSPALLPTTSSQ